MKDLALIVADKEMSFSVRGILARHQALGIRPVVCEIDVQFSHDGGVRTTGPETLALLRNEFQHGLLMLDLEGSGSDLSDPVALEAELDAHLRPAWGDRAKAIVIQPELETWVWGSDNSLSDVLRWKDGSIRAWAVAQGYVFAADGKPLRPKEAFRDVLRRLKTPPSSAIYERVTGKMSLAKCIDPAFRRFRETLVSWFPPV